MSGNPFAGADDPVRRLRGRLGGAVSLWTAGEGSERAGLTVSSLMVANGEPGRILGLLDPDADLTARLGGSGRGVVQLLTWRDRDLAEAFAGTSPAPGGPFRLGDWEQTPYGPVLVDRTRALVSVEELREVGWSTLATLVVEDLLLLPDEDALTHRRGRYHHDA